MPHNPVCVTGAAGFIGFHVAKALLARGEEVVGIDNLNDYYDVRLKQARLAQISDHPHFTFEKIDIADKKSMEAVWSQHGPFRRVVHLAAQPGVRYSIENPYAYMHSNGLGHLTVLEMCRHTPDFEHLVYASSSSVYGGNTKMPFSIEDDVSNPVSLYAATKRSNELVSQSYGNLYHLPQTGLRFFTVYGPWGRPDMAMFIFTKAIAEGKPLPLYNGGKLRRDFTYIDDVVSGIIAALDTPPLLDQEPHRLFNLGNTKSEDLMDFITAIEKALGKKAILDMKDMQKGDVKETYADISETARALGYTPTTSITQGVPQFVDWYREYYQSD